MLLIEDLFGELFAVGHPVPLNLTFRSGGDGYSARMGFRD